MTTEIKRKSILDPKKLNQLIAIAANKSGFVTTDKDPNSPYRHDILKNLTGKTSVSDMSIVEKMKVLEHFKKQYGFKVTAKKSPNKNPPWLKKLLSLWLEMHAAGYIRNPSFKALEAWALTTLAKHNGVPTKLEWMNEFSKVLIEALKQYKERCEIKQKRKA